MKTEKFIIEIDSATLMGVKLETSKTQFKQQLSKLTKDWKTAFEDDEEYQNEMGARIDYDDIQYETIHEIKTTIWDGTTRYIFHQYICNDGYVFKNKK